MAYKSDPTLERRRVSYKMTKPAASTGEFSGYTSVFGVVDDYGDIVDHGAFRKTLKESHGKIPVFYGHDVWVGMGISAREDQHGLDVDGVLSVVEDQERGLRPIQAATDALALMNLAVAHGASPGLSIGFRRVKQIVDDKERTHITELRLFEYSILPPGFNACPGSNVTEMRMVVPYQDLPLADLVHPWSGSGARSRVKAHASAGDDIDFGKYRRAFLWYDSSAPDELSSYKLPIGDVVDGKLTVIPRAVFAAAAVLQGARGGADIPEADRAKCRSHLERYYARLEQEPPWKSKSIAALVGGDVAGILQAMDIQDDLALLLADEAGAAAASGEQPQDLHCIREALDEVLRTRS